MARVFGPDVFTANGNGKAYQGPDLGVIITVTAVVTATSGNCAADITLQGSNDGNTWFNVGATLNNASAASPNPGVLTRVQFAYAQYRVNVANLTGTGAVCTTYMAIAS
jgi:hypothetical protein